MLDSWLAEVRAGGRGQMVLLGGRGGRRQDGDRPRLRRAAPVGHVLAGGCEALFTPRPLGPLLDIAAEVGGELAEVTERGASASEVLAASGARAARRVDRRPRGPPLGRRGDARRRAAARPAGGADAGARDRDLSRRRARRATTRCASCSAQLGDAHRIDGRAAVGGRGGTAGGGARRRRRRAARPHRRQPVLRDRGARAPRPPARPTACATPCSPARRAWTLRRGGCWRPWPSRGRARRSGCWSGSRRTSCRSSRTCLASGMLRAEGDAVAFRHEIARATIEDDLPPDRRVALHRAALAALVGRGEPARLAHHAEAAGDGAAVLEHAQAAGERAARLGAHREAAAHFAAALGHAGGLEPAARAALLERRAEACFLSGMIEEAVDAETAGARDLRGDRGPAAGGRRAPAARGCSPGTRATARASSEETATAVEILESAAARPRARAGLRAGVRRAP